MAVRAVQADEDRIALELVETVIRDLFRVGLRLTSESQRAGEPRQPCVIEALEGIDQVIKTIRGVVFGLGVVPRQRIRRYSGVGASANRLSACHASNTLALGSAARALRPSNES
jgi:hypothetical protein